MSRLGLVRPVSMKLTCRVEMSASSASSIWLRWRCWRQLRRWSPNEAGPAVGAAARCGKGRRGARCDGAGTGFMGHILGAKRMGAITSQVIDAVHGGRHHEAFF